LEFKNNISKKQTDLLLINYIDQIERILVSHFEKDVFVAQICISAALSLLRETKKLDIIPSSDL
jgi:hypothetical protein